MAASDFYTMFSGLGENWRKVRQDSEAKDASLAYADAVLGAPAGGPAPTGLAALGKMIGFPQGDAPKPQQPGGLAALSPEIGKAAAAISGIESGGNYGALGPVTKTGDRAIGKYQIMAANIPSWSQEALGRPVTPQEFAANPQLQDAVFQHKFGQYVQKYGPEGAARAWFAGEGGMNNPNARDQLGTSVASYGQKFSQAYGGGAGAPPMPPPQQQQGMPPRAMPGGAMAYSAAGQPVRTDAQGRALNPDGTPTGPGMAPAQQAIQQAAPQAPPQAPPSPYGNLNGDVALPDWKGAPPPMSLAALGQAQAAPQPPAPMARPMPPQAMPPQQAAPMPPQQMAQAAPQSRQLFTPEESQALRAMIANPQTRAQAMGIIQARQTPKDGYTLKPGEVRFDSNGRQLATVAPVEDGTPDLKNYAAAVRQGYKGDFNKWYTDIKQAGATTVTVDKSENKFAEAAGTGIAKRFEGLVTEGDSAVTDKALIGQLQDLGSVIGTGGPAALQSWLADKGIAVGPNVGLIQAYEAIVNKMTPAQRIPGSGATSDYDAKMFKGSINRLINTPEGNQIISGTLSALADHKIARAAIAEQALNREITPQKAAEQLRALPNPYDRFKEYQKGDKGQPASAAPSGQAPVAKPASGAPVRVQSPDEARKLPKGTPIILPDGRQGVVP